MNARSRREKVAAARARSHALGTWRRVRNASLVRMGSGDERSAVQARLKAEPVCAWAMTEGSPPGWYSAAGAWQPNAHAQATASGGSRRRILPTRED